MAHFPCTVSLHLVTSALLRASRAVWNARARVLIVRVVENFVVTYLELRTTLRYVTAPG